MKKHIALHTDPIKMSIALLLFTLTLLFLMSALLLSTNKDIIRLSSLIRSDYDYSVLMQDTVQKDDYYQFNAGIEFALSADANTGMNADIVMQSKDSVYTDMIDWNADTIGTNGVAISKNLAKSNHLNIGDKLYSKHIVNGEKYEYTIEQLVPEAVNIRFSKERSHSDGIIIMGYDKRYIENITHSSIVFTKDSINDLSMNGSPENIIYRDDEIKASFRIIIPYLIIICAFSVAITIVLVVFLSKNVSSNFRRLIMIGYNRKRLNASYYRLVFGLGLIAIVASSALSGIVFSVINFSVIKLLFMLLIPFKELITLFLASCILNRRLWRK